MYFQILLIPIAFCIFTTFLGALVLGFGIQAASIGIIGGADGPTEIYLTTKLAPYLLAPIAVTIVVWIYVNILDTNN